MSGTAAAGPVEAEVDLSASQLIENLQFGAMLNYRSEAEKFAVTADVIFMGLGASREGTNGLQTTKVDVDQWIAQAHGSWRVTPVFEALAGLRFTSVSGTTILTPVRGDVRSAGFTKSWIDPIVGVRAKAPVGKGWSLEGYGDIGGFGVGCDLTWMLQGRVNWQVSPVVGVGLGYRALYQDYGTGSAATSSSGKPVRGRRQHFVLSAGIRACALATALPMRLFAPHTRRRKSIERRRQAATGTPEKERPWPAERPGAAGDGGCSLRPDRAGRGGGKEAEHHRHLLRRRRAMERQRLPPRHDGRPHAQHRPDREPGRALHRLLRAAILHGRPLGVHHGTASVPHGPSQGRVSGGQAGHPGQGRDHRRTAQAARLRHGPDREEPSRRPQRVPAHRPRIRRVLRIPLPPERDGRAGRSGLPEEPAVPGPVRPARRHRQRRLRQGRPDRRPALRTGRQAGHQGRRPAHRKRMETVDDEFTARSLAFIEKSVKAGKPFFLWHSSTRMHFKTHLSPKWEGKTGYGLAADAMARAGRQRRRNPQEARRPEDRRQHHRGLHQRQRSGDLHLARRGQHAVQGREGHDDGGRLPRTVRRPLARRDQAGHRDQRDHVHGGLAADVLGRRRRRRREDEAPRGHCRPATGPTRSISTATTSCRTSRATRPRRARVTRSSTSTTART